MAQILQGLPEAGNGEYLLLQEANVPLRDRDNHQVIHDTATVEYVIKLVEFKKQRNFLLSDYQFALSTKVKSNQVAEQVLATHKAQDKALQRKIDMGTKKGKRRHLPPDERIAEHGNLDLPNQLEEPLLEDCLSGIQDSIVKVLEKLKGHYGQQAAGAVAQQIRERCYITVCHGKLDTGIKVGNFYLEKENLSNIADLVTTKINNFINSGSYIKLNVPLDESFQIRFVMVGQDHVQYRKQNCKGGYEPNRYNENDLVAGDDGNATKRNNWRFKTPLGYHGNSNAFVNQCLLVSCVAGKFLNEINEIRHQATTTAVVTSASTKSLIVYFKYGQKHVMSKLVGAMFEKELSKLYSHLKINATTVGLPLGICDKIATFYKVQFIIFDEETPPRVQLFPPVANLRLRSIFLYLTKKDKTFYHVDVIKNVETFFNTRGFACIGCKFGTKHYGSFRHFCEAKETRSCFACRRPILKFDTYINGMTANLFCDSRLHGSKEEFEKCKSCGLMLYSKSCRISHRKKGFCKRLGFTCSKCGKFALCLRLQNNIGTHKCKSLQKCPICQEIKKGGSLHLCPWKEPKATIDLENLAFLHLSYKMLKSSCYSCSSNENSFSCDQHPFGPETEIKPILGNFLFEKGVHGNFDRFCCYDPQFIKQPVEKLGFLSFSYFPEGVPLPKELNVKKPLTRFNKFAAVDKNLKEQITKLKQKQNKTVLEQILSKILTEEYQNYTILATDCHVINFVIQAMIVNGIIPKSPMVKGSSAISVRMPAFNIRFASLNQFLPGSLDDHKKQFNLPQEIEYFPNLLFLGDDQCDLSLPTAPPFTYYQDIMDTPSKKLDKMAFWNKVRSSPFSYVSSLEAVSDSELKICSLACLYFVETSMNFQAQCLTHFGRPSHYKEDSLPITSALSYQSMPSFMKNTFRCFALEKNVLFAVRDQYGSKQPHSLLEHEVTEFLRYTEPKKWTTFYSSIGGQKEFHFQTGKRPFLLADAYNAAEKICFFFHGCFWHGHENCLLTSPKSQADVNYQKRRERSTKQVEMLLTYWPEEVTSVEMLYECEYKELKKPFYLRTSTVLSRVLPPVFETLKSSGCERLRQFLAGPLLRPLEPLAVRDAFSASLCEAYTLSYVKKEGDGKQCHILDVSSLFPFVAITYPMPCGPYFTVRGDDLLQDEVTFDLVEETLLFQGVPVSAIVHCRVFPPNNLLHPFLHTKIKNTVVGTLCRTCSEEATITVVPAEEMLCRHTSFERSFVGNFTSQELAYARTLSYNFQFFELMVYPKSDFFLRKFLTLLGFYKLRHCNYPASVGEDEEKQEQYCRELNSAMNFKSILDMELSPNNISPNKKMRVFYKACLNSFLGTLGTNVEKYTTVKFLNHYRQLVPYLDNERLMDMHPMSESILRIALQNKETTPSRVNNVTVSCVITSMARVLVHKKMQELVFLDATILRVSCDCIYFVMDEHQTIPFKLSEAFGCYKEEFRNIESVAQASVKNLSVMYHDESDGSLKQHLVTAGTTINESNSIILNHKCYEQIIDQLVKNIDVSSVNVCRLRRMGKKKKNTKLAQRQKMFARNICLRRRILPQSTYYQTVPYGWQQTGARQWGIYLSLLLRCRNSLQK